MKIAIASDLHLEYSDLVIKNTEAADILVLAGDIMIAQDLHDHPEPATPYTPEIIKLLGSRQKKAQEYRDFLKRCSFQFKHVIMIAGNHEFYHGRFVNSLTDLHNECAKFPNVYFLENETKTIEGINFIGCTLWTDFRKGDPVVLNAMPGIMNDYNMIRHDGLGFTKLRPAHTLSRHRKSVEYIRETLASKPNETFVVVGHMAPSVLSIHEKYRDQHLENTAYYSDLTDIMLDNTNIKLWIHGHTHFPFDYQIGQTRVVCNPRGYVGYERGTQDADPYYPLYVEV